MPFCTPCIRSTDSSVFLHPSKSIKSLLHRKFFKKSPTFIKPIHRPILKSKTNRKFERTGSNFIREIVVNSENNQTKNSLSNYDITVTTYDNHSISTYDDIPSVSNHEMTSIYDNTPSVSNYDMTTIYDDSQTSVYPQPPKKIARWARKSQIQLAIINQIYYDRKPEDIFGSVHLDSAQKMVNSLELQNADLPIIFVPRNFV